ncbi:MAG: LysE family translocator [Parahaliea sp.]
MDFSHWLSLCTLCLLGAISPGPSLAVVVNTTLHSGSRSGYASALAHGVGVALYGLITVAGLALLITRSPAVFATLQILGASYLLYLGIVSLRATDHRIDRQTPYSATRLSVHSAAWQGFLIAFFNPKLAIFMLALFSQFLSPDSNNTQKALMVATVGTTDGLWYCLIASVVSRSTVRAHLEANALLISQVFGILLILVACGVLWQVLIQLLAN